MADTTYTVDYEDQRFKDVESDKKQALTDLENTYGGMIDGTDKHFEGLIQASKDWAKTQAANQQAQTDFAIAEIEQQKAQTKKDYTKEQSGAYVDWQKQSNAYGANAEAMAAQGMYGTGYSESSQVAMYTAYQNRITTAKEAYALAVQNYNNSITEARLQNNAILAEIAAKALQEQLELALRGFQYKNDLIIAKASEKRKIDDTYYGRYMDVVDQINTENALAEEARQYNETKELQERQVDIQEEQLELQKQAQINKTSGARVNKISGKRTTSGSKSTKKTVNKGSGGSTIKNASVVSQYEKDTKKNVPSGKATIDMNSVIALGYGPISADRLNQLIAQGLVQEYRDGNKIKFRLSPNYIKQRNLIK